MIRVILFDLDGTLLDNDMDAFLRPYFKALSAKISPLVAPDRLIQQVLASTQVMIRSAHPARTNEEVFAEDFFRKIGRPREELMPVFNEFYEKEFVSLKKYVQTLPEAREVVGAAVERGYAVVIATSPVFPLRAVEHRLEWAGVADFPYALITSYENMHFCKPHPGYYLEIAGRIGRRPEECVMVGNDPEADIAPAAKAGMRTFCVDHRGNKDVLPVATDARGTLDDFRRLLESWPSPK